MASVVNGLDLLVVGVAGKTPVPAKTHRRRETASEPDLEVPVAGHRRV
jgi:hypothetical protein